MERNEAWSCLVMVGWLVGIRSGVLRMQKVRTPLVGAKGYQKFPLFKPGVGI